MSTAVCPVCSQTFLQSKLETHVNKCLDGDGDADEPFQAEISDINTTVNRRIILDLILTRFSTRKNQFYFLFLEIIQ